MKTSYKTDKHIQAEILKIGRLDNVEDKIKRLTILVFHHTIFSSMPYSILALNLKEYSDHHIELGEDILRQYKSKKPGSKFPSSSRLKEITSAAVNLDMKNELLKDIYRLIKNCEAEEFFDKCLMNAKLTLNPVFERAIEFQKKYEAKLEESVIVLSNFKSEIEIIESIREIYAREKDEEFWTI